MPRIRFDFGSLVLDAELGDETRLASPCNIFAEALSDVKMLAKVKAGTRIKVTVIA